MKVAYLLHQFPVLSETFVLDEILELEQKKDLEIGIFAFQDSEESLRHPEVKKLKTEIQYAGFGIVFVFWHLFFFFRSPIRYLMQLRFLSRMSKREFFQIYELMGLVWRFGADHVHAHFAGLSATAAMMISGYLGIPFSFTVHARDLFVAANDLPEKIRSSRFVAAISEFNKQRLCQIEPSVSMQKIKVVRCGVLTDQFVPLRETMPSEPFMILSGGRLVEKKGFEDLLQACAKLKEQGLSFRCEIYGSGPLRQKLELEVRALSLRDRVHFLGALDRGHVKEKLRKSHAFVLPCVVAKDGDRDGIPVALMEAMSAGLPVVSTAVSGIPELIQSRVNGILVSEKAPEELAQALCSLASDIPMRQTLGIRAREKIKDVFDARKNAEYLAGLFLEKTRKILYVSHTSCLGGAEMSLYQLIKHMDRSLFEPMGVLPGKGWLLEALQSLKVHVKLSSVEEFSRNHPFRFLKQVVRLWMVIREEKPELVHANSIYAAETAWAASALAGIPCVGHVRDLCPVLGAGKMRQKAFLGMKRVIAISEAVRADLIQELAVPKDKITRIYNGADIIHFHPSVSGTRVREELGLGNRKVIGMVGRLSPEKGGEIFLKCGKKILIREPGVSLLVVGSEELGPRGFGNHLSGLAASLGISKDVIFCGARKDLPHVMAALDVLVVPSKAEPFGRVIIEAMASGKPVVAFEAGGAIEILSQGGGVLVPQGDEDAMTEAVLDLIRSPERAREVGEKGRQIVELWFSIQKHVQEIEMLYEEVLSEKQGRRWV